MLKASFIVDQLGGNKAVAEELGITRNAVQRWQYGPNDRVPMGKWGDILKLAARRGVALSLEDLIPPAAIEAEQVRKSISKKTPRARRVAA